MASLSLSPYLSLLAACSLLLGVGTECRLPGHDQRLAAGRLLRTDPHSSLLTLPFFSTSSFPLTLRSSPRLPPSQSLEVGGYFAASSAVRVSCLARDEISKLLACLSFSILFCVCVFLFFAPFFLAVVLCPAGLEMVCLHACRGSAARWFTVSEPVVCFLSVPFRSRCRFACLSLCFKCEERIAAGALAVVQSAGRCR